MTALASDLPDPVPEPTGPTRTPAYESIILDVPEAPGSTIAVADPSVDSIVGAPELTPRAPVAAAGQVILAVTAPWYVNAFNSSIAGVPVVSDGAGTVVSADVADAVIASGAASGITIVKR